jgi:methionine-rich copper-binding protein CopC
MATSYTEGADTTHVSHPQLEKDSTFSGTTSNFTTGTDDDYFEIDIGGDGFNDTAGSLTPGAQLTITFQPGDAYFYRVTGRLDSYENLRANAFLTTNITFLRHEPTALGPNTITYTVPSSVPSHATLEFRIVGSSDAAGNPLNYTITLGNGAADTTAPTLQSSVPADNATAVAVGSNITLTFSESVKAGTGNIEIRRSSDNSLFKSISVTDINQVSFSQSTLTINPSEDLAPNTGYYVLIPAGAVKDLANNNYAGLTTSTQLNFTTVAADVTPPLLQSTTPQDNQTGVVVSSNITLVFNEAVKAGTGAIEIRKVSDDTAVATIPVTDINQISFSNTSVVINPSNDLAGGTDYYVYIPAGAIKDLAGNSYAGLTTKSALNFSTVGNRAPVGVDDHIQFTGSNGVTTNIVSNDSDPDGDTVSISRIVANAQYGTVTYNANGSVTYKPRSDLSPAAVSADGFIYDSVTFEITDGPGSSSSGAQTLGLIRSPADAAFDTEVAYYKYGINDFYVELGELPAVASPLPTISDTSANNTPTIPAYARLSYVDAGFLPYMATVTYHFTSSLTNPSTWTEYMDFRNYNGTPHSSPSLRASFNNNEPDLQNQKMNSMNLGFSMNPTWYEDPLHPGGYFIVLTNTERTPENPITLEYSIHRQLIADHVGNTPYWARDMSTAGHAKTSGYAEYVSRGDGHDYYKYTITQPSAVAFALVKKSSSDSIGFTATYPQSAGRRFTLRNCWCSTLCLVRLRRRASEGQL